MNEKPDPKKDEPGIDMTELAAAIAKLNGKEPPAGAMIVPASIMSPVTQEFNRREAEAAAAAAAALAAEKEANPVAGQKMNDGTIYVGISPTTHERMFAAPADALSKTFNEAAEEVKNFEVGGRQDFRVPDTAELRLLFKNKDKDELSGTFSPVRGPDPLFTGWYWSSESYSEKAAYGQWFHTGNQSGDFAKKSRTYVRYVR